MSEHPINGLMQTAMENIKDMVDVNTIVGEPVQTPDGSVIIPISKVGFGFAAGGSEFSAEEQNGVTGTAVHSTASHNAQVQLPFGGGSGGGVSITPIAFLVVGTEGVKVVPLDNQTHILERLIESAPQWVDKVKNLFQSTAQTGLTAGGMPMGAAGMGMQQSGTSMSGTSMPGASMPGGSMSGGSMLGGSSSGTSMSGTSMPGTSMPGTSMPGTSATGTSANGKSTSGTTPTPASKTGNNKNNGNLM
jgi:sporulation protein YtfJ